MNIFQIILLAEIFIAVACAILCMNTKAWKEWEAGLKNKDSHKVRVQSSKCQTSEMEVYEAFKYAILVNSDILEISET